MRWRLKSRLLWLFSALPGGPWAYRRLPAWLLASRKRPLEELTRVKSQAAKLLAERKAPSHPATVFEIGAGRDLAWALAFAAAGAGRVWTFDIARLARPALVRRAAAAILPPAARLRALVELGPLASIEYRAPSDARQTGLDENSVDLAFSSDVLEHVPPAEIIALLKEMRRVLRPGASACAFINYDDHFSSADPHIGPRHFLTFSDAAWRRHNAPLHYQNRLRHSEHMALWRAAGFQPRAQVLRRLPLSVEERSRLAPRFAGMDNDDLEILGARISAVKKD